ncbi:MAG: hypothetical protein GY720_11065 [bacterium]|nr:hypothetical protein [bacterium]
MEFTLLFAVAIAFVAGSIALRWEAARGNAVDCASDLQEVLLTAAIAGIFVGRLVSMVASGVNPLTNLADILIVRGGVATGPATVAALLTIAFVARGEIIAVADALAVASLASLGGWHLGCLARDACLGTASDLPWAMTQSGSSVGRHPIELYAAAILLMAAAALALRRKRPLPPGVAAATALGLASAVRLATEPLRPSLGGGPVWWYLTGLLGAIGALLVIWRRATATTGGTRVDT